MAVATAKVEVSFVTAPLAVATWVDITAYVLDLKTTSGRSRELEPFDVTTATITLNNRTRVFDPFNSAGAYYGNLLPNKQVRITALYSATTYDVWYGYIDGWPQSYSPPADSIITVNASDAFKLLGAMRLDESVYAKEVLADSPTAWWRFAETGGVLYVDSSGNNYHATLGTANDRTKLKGSGKMLPEAGESLEIYDTVNPYAVPPNATAVTSPCSFEFWFNGSAYSGGTVDYTVWSTAGSSAIIIKDKKIRWETSTGNYEQTDSQHLYDGQLHHVVLTKSGGTVLIYVDGVEVPSTTTGTVGFLATSTPLLFPGITIGGSLEPPTQSLVAEFAIYPSVLSAARCLAHYNAGFAPWNGDNTGTRAQRYLDAVSWPSARYDIDTGNNTAGIAKLDKRTAAELLRVAESTEQGQTYVNHRDGGKIKVAKRQSRLTASRSINSQFTFSDDGADGTAYRYEKVDLVYDDRDIVNEVQVVWQSGTEIVSDATSIAAYGMRSLTIETELGSQSQANDLGMWVLNRYKEPIVRCKSLTLAPGRRSDATWLPSLDLKINDRITVRVLPQNSGAAITKTVLVEGIDHDVSGLDWVTTLHTTETDANSYWIWGVSTWGNSTRWGY